jgi:prevent-host-death family protein
MRWPICLGQLRCNTGGYIDRVAAGETLEIVRRGKLVARIVPAHAPGDPRRDAHVGGHLDAAHSSTGAWIQLSHLRRHAASYLDRVAAGETIAIIRRDTPVARIVSVAPPR